MITRFKIFEQQAQSLTDNDGILIIVDVQKEFDKFIPQGYVSKLKDYCRTFDKVYQIWDTTKASKPTYKFPNQTKSVDKRFGHKWFNKTINSYIDTFKLQSLSKGKLFQLGEKNEYVVFTGNNHKWFYVNERLAKMFSKLEGKKVILCGGADWECLEDVDLALKAFGVDSMLNHSYVYSAQTNSSQVSTQPIQQSQQIQQFNR